MSVGLDCSRSCLVTFTPAIYKTTGVDEIVPSLAPVLPDDVTCIQFLSQGKVRITFESAESVSAMMEEQLKFNGVSLPVQSADPRSRLVYLRDCPSEVSDAAVRQLLAPYGAVREVTTVHHNKFPRISTGTRRISMSVVRDIPSSLRVMGFDCRVWYPGQPSLCPICRKPGHPVKKCPDHGKCRRCHQPGHVARQCRRAWGTATVAPSGSTAPVASTTVTDPGARADSDPRAPPSSSPPAAVVTLPLVTSVSVDTALLVSNQLVDEDDMATDYAPSDSSSEEIATSTRVLRSAAMDVVVDSDLSVATPEVSASEVAAPEGTLSVVTASQVLPESQCTPVLDDTPVPSNVSSGDSCVASVFVDPHPDILCPMAAWEWLDGDALNEETICEYLHNAHADFADLRVGSSLSSHQVRLFKSLVSDGSIWFDVGPELIPNPFV